MKRKSKLAEAIQDNNTNKPLKILSARAKRSLFMMLALPCTSATASGTSATSGNNAYYVCKLCGDKLSRDMGSEDARSDNILGLTEYYDIILNRKGLVAKESEFRTNKLSLVLDFLRVVCIPENLWTELTSVIIDAWRLQVPERTLWQREDEMKKVMSSIESIRYAIKWIKRHKSSTTGSQLDAIILSNLPLMTSDLRHEDAPAIYDLLDRVRDQSL